MANAHPEELFRYVRVRGATTDMATPILVTPPPGFTSRTLRPIPGEPDHPPGLNARPAPASSAGSAVAGPPPTVGPSSADDGLQALGEALARGDPSALEQARATPPPTTEQIASLWDGLAEALLNPGRHAEATSLTNSLRAAWLCERLSGNGPSDEVLLEEAREAVVHLRPVPSDPAPPPASPPAAPALPSSPAQPSAGDRKAELDSLAQLIREVQAAPAKLVQQPLATDSVTAADRSISRSFFSRRSETSTAKPATTTEIGYDLSGLSPASRVLAQRLGGGESSAQLLDRAEAEVERLSRAMAADAPSGQRIVVSGGMASVVSLPQRDSEAAAQIEDTARDISPQIATKCPVRVRGVAEFLRVEQTLVEYRAGELAHVENVLQGEMKERLARSLTRSEQTVVEETERTEETERESQTTSRFDMEKEAEKALSTVAETHGGISASVSATSGYATVVVEGNLGFSSQSTGNEVAKTATKFSQSVTNRALDRIKTRVAQSRTSKTLAEFEDTARHVLDNRGGADHVVGAYRWIDKVYSARVMNYGARIAIEVLIENPGAFLRPTQARRDIDLPRPLDWNGHPFGPLTSPKDVDRFNYAYFAGLYGAEVKPPPRDVIFVSKAEARPPEILGDAVHVAGEIEIPDGYESVRFYGRGNLVRPFSMNGSPGMRVFLNSAELTFGPYSANSAPLNDCTGRVAYAIASWTRMYSMTIAIECRLSTEGGQAWQLQTYAKIREAYDRLVQEARNESAQEQARQGVAIQGRNPLANAEIVRVELKKAAIWALCVGEQFWLDEEGMAVCPENGTTLPRLDSATCERLKLASLLESAIDWNLMTFQLLPYYWANACDWQERMGYADADPQYAEFLRAGAARIVVPVANGKAAALELLYFLNTGHRWTGSSPPPLLADPDGLAAYVESAALETGPPKPVGDPWTVVVPTALTVLECGSACVDGDLVAARLSPQGKKAKLVSSVAENPPQ
jgi:hypothetical protein